MKASSPAFQFYPKDYMTDANVMEMTHEQRGIYIDLLSIYWLEDGLPSDLGRLARLVGLPPKRFERLWPAISRCFKIEGGALRQKRLEEEKLKQATYKDKQRRKGALGGKAKAINKTRNPRLQSGYAPAVAESKPEGSFPFSVSVSVPIPSTATETETNRGADGAPPFPSQHAADVYLRFYPGGRPPKPMFRELRPLVLKHTWAVVEPELVAYLESTEVQFHSWPKFASGFGSWANGRAGPRGQPKASVGDRTMAALKRAEERRNGERPESGSAVPEGAQPDLGRLPPGA